MYKMTIQISKKNLEKIYNYARKTYPEECCGLLVGIIKQDKKIIKEVHETKNISPNKLVTYKIDPMETLDILKKIDKKYSILGCYHSHPNLLPKPSFIDLSGALENFSYLIVSLNERKILDTRCWTYIDCEIEFVEDKIFQK